MDNTDTPSTWTLQPSERVTSVAPRKLDIPDLLQLMIGRYNLEALEFDRLGQYNDQLLAEKLEDDERLQRLRHQVKALEDRDTIHALERAELAAKLDKYESAEEDHWAELLRVNQELQQAQGRAERAEEALAKLHQSSQHQIHALQGRLDNAEAALHEARHELASLRGDDNPKKLKQQVKRIKEKNTELQARNDRLMREAGVYQQDIQEFKRRNREAIDKIRLLQLQNDSLSFSRIFSQGDHHLIVWPQVVGTMHAETRQPMHGRALLCMHQSGRAGLVIQDPETGKAAMMPAPKGGLKLPGNLAEIASEWLHRVNQVQGGNITEADFKLIEGDESK